MSNGDSPIKASPESLYTQAIADSQASSSMSNNQSSNHPETYSIYHRELQQQHKDSAILERKRKLFGLY